MTPARAAFQALCTMCGITRHMVLVRGCKFRICSLCDGAALRQRVKECE